MTGGPAVVSPLSQQGTIVGVSTPTKPGRDLSFVARNGGSRMAVFGGSLTATQISDVAAYVTRRLAKNP